MPLPEADVQPIAQQRDTRFSLWQCEHHPQEKARGWAELIVLPLWPHPLWHLAEISHDTLTEWIDEWVWAGLGSLASSLAGLGSFPEKDFTPLPEDTYSYLENPSHCRCWEGVEHLKEALNTSGAPPYLEPL